jgi:hypothetical protein
MQQLLPLSCYCGKNEWPPIDGVTAVAKESLEGKKAWEKRWKDLLLTLYVLIDILCSILLKAILLTHGRE